VGSPFLFLVGKEIRRTVSVHGVLHGVSPSETNSEKLGDDDRHHGTSRRIDLIAQTPTKAKTFL